MLKKIFKNSILRERKHVEMPLRRERERERPCGKNSCH
jgi:hypothetical protein